MIRKSKRRREEELDDELRFHLEMEREKLRRRGLSEGEAQRKARLALGGVEPVKEAVRAEWRGSTMETVIRDVRYAARSLLKNPGFSVAAIVTLALGIGANTAIFSLVNGVLLRPLPYREGDRLVLLQQQAPKAGLDTVAFSIPEVYDYRRQTTSLRALVEHHSMTFTLLGRNEPERVSTGVVSAEFFDALGVVPLLGRTFRPEDDDLGAEAVLVLSYGYWQRSFGGDPEIVGRVFQMNDRPHTVVGVLPPIPQFPVEHDVYMPTSACPFRAAGERNMAGNRNAFRAMTVFARLDDGVALDRARTDLEAVAGHLARDYPETYASERGYTITAKPLQEVLTRQAQPTLLVLLATAGLVLLIACANVANLSFARMLRRQREMAIRASLGASRWRLAQQTLAESMVLSLLGGALGLLMAYGGLDLLVAFTARFTPRAVGIRIDGWVLLFTAVLSILTGLFFGALPALGRYRRLVGALREGGSSTASRGHQRFRAALITAQVAVAAVLLVGAGLTLRSFYRLSQVDPGFATENVLTARLARNWSKYQTTEDASRFLSAVLERVRAIPGVTAAAVGSRKPLDGLPPFASDFRIESRPIDEGELAPRAAVRVASIDYFRTMGIPLLGGRSFALTDDGEAPLVAVVNRALARAYWGASDPLLDRISLDGGETWHQVVGIVGDVHEEGLDTEPVQAVYVPLPQGFWAQSLVVAARGEPLQLARQIKDAVWALDPEQAIDDFETLEQTRRAAMTSPRLTATLLGLFALLALVITATGIAGVIAFAVSQRTQEIGIRMALGAARSEVVLMLVRQGLLMVGVGLAVGLAVALASGRFLADLLYETRATDLPTLLAVVLVLVFAGSVASLVPARRATAVDPTTSLRSE